jgi:hypothetical protein
LLEASIYSFKTYTQTLNPYKKNLLGQAIPDTRDAANLSPKTNQHVLRNADRRKTRSDGAYDGQCVGVNFYNFDFI